MVDQLRSVTTDLAQRLSAMEVMTEERFRAQETAMNLALSANDKRLDGLNEFRQALSDQSTTLLTRSEAETSFRNLDQKFVSDLDRLREKAELIGRPNYMLGGIVVSTIFALVTGMWVVIGLKIEASAAPLAVAMEQVKGSQAAQLHQITDIADHLRGIDTATASLDGRLVMSTSDRAQLNERMHQVEAEVPRISTGMGTRLADLAERMTRAEVWQEVVRMRVSGDLPSGAPRAKH